MKLNYTGFGNLCKRSFFVEKKQPWIYLQEACEVTAIYPFHLGFFVSLFFLCVYNNLFHNLIIALYWLFFLRIRMNMNERRVYVKVTICIPVDGVKLNFVAATVGCDRTYKCSLASYTMFITNDDSCICIIIFIFFNS